MFTAFGRQGSEAINIDVARLGRITQHYASFLLGVTHLWWNECPLGYPLRGPEQASGCRNHPCCPHMASLRGQCFCAARICITTTRSSVDKRCARCFNRRRRFSAFSTMSSNACGRQQALLARDAISRYGRLGHRHQSIRPLAYASPSYANPSQQ